MTDIPELDQEHENLLDVFNRQCPAGTQGEGISRVTLIGKWNSTLSAALSVERGDDILAAVKACRAEDDTSSVTGHLLLYSTCFAAQLEAVSGLLSRILQAFNAKHATFGCDVVQVVSFTDDIGVRAFSLLTHAYTDSQPLEAADGLEEQAAVAAASDVNLSFIHLGHDIRGYEATKTHAIMHDLAAHWDRLPTPDSIISLLLSAMVPSLSAYLRIFNGVVNIDFESECTWPVENLPPIS